MPQKPQLPPHHPDPSRYLQPAQRDRAFDVAGRRRRAWELKVRYRYSLERIQEQLQMEGWPEVALKYIDADIRKQERWALNRFGRNADAEKARQVASLEVIYGCAMLAWDHSVQDAKLLRERTVDVPAPVPPRANPAVPSPAPPPVRDRTETTHEIRERVGDPRFLTVALKALDSIRLLCEAKPGPIDADDPYARLPSDVAARLREMRRNQASDVLALLAARSGADYSETDLASFSGN